MPFSAPFRPRRPLAPALTAAALAALLGGPAFAAEPAPEPALPSLRAPAAAPQGAAESGPVLKRLPASRPELTLAGEAASRSWTLVFSRVEAARTTTLQVSLLNAVSVFPDRSSVTIALNGTVLAVLPAAAAQGATVIPVKIPPGLLVPGPNTVQVSSALAHRVDCSVKATYELWAQLDPVATGFLVPRDVAEAAHTLDDLAAEPLAADGTTRIHLRLKPDAGAVEIGEAARLIDALARRAGLARPIVDVGPEPGRGAGFDVVLDLAGQAGDALDGVKFAGAPGGARIGRHPATGRLTVALAAADLDEMDRAIGALAAEPGAGRSEPIAGGSRTTLAALGFAGGDFAGRHYAATIDVTLPPDFYPANDRARLLIDGAHAAALVPGSQLVFRVNGTLVSTIALAAGQAERFEGEVVELPLRFFHPGHNALAIEGTTSALADAQCDLTRMSRDARLTVSGTSVLEFPDYARLATLPQIPAALAYDSAPDGGPLNLYLGHAGFPEMGAGLTLLANMASSGMAVGTPVVHLGTPGVADAPGLLVAATDQLPSEAAATLRRLTAAEATAPAATAGSLAPLDAAALANDARLGRTLHKAAASAEALLRSRGFFFGSGEAAARLPVSDATMLVAALPPEAAAPRLGGVRLPQFVHDPAHWLVVTAPRAEQIESGMGRLVAEGHWSALAGQAVSLDLQSGALTGLQPTRLAYVMPQRLVLADIRPILGGIVSNNVALSIGLLMALMAVLGVSTHLIIGRMGAK